MVQMEEHHISDFVLPDMDSTFRIFAAHLRTVTSAWSYPSHRHPLFEVNLLLQGAQEMKVNGVTYTQHPGDLVLLRPEDVHESRVVGDEPMTYYCLHFDVDERVLREQLFHSSACYFSRESELTLNIRPSLDKLIELTSRGGTVNLPDKMRVLSAVFELFAGLSESLADHPGPVKASIQEVRIATEIAAGLEKVVESEKGSEIIATDQGTRDTVAAVAAGVGYSASSRNRIFHRVYGMSPRQYLSGLKLKKAKLLLMNPELSVESVSSSLGYRDIAHFSRQFKRWTGESPGKFRSRFHI